MSTSIGTTDFGGPGGVLHYDGYEDTRKKFAKAIESGGGIARLPRAARLRLWQAFLVNYQHGCLLRVTGGSGNRQFDAPADVNSTIKNARIRAMEQIHQLSRRYASVYSTRDSPWPHLLTPVIILAEACVLRFWSDETAVLNLLHEETGWVEIDVPVTALPADVRLGDRIPITVFTDEQGRILDWAIEPDAKVVTLAEPEPHPLRPREPTDWNDPADVARYRQELDRLFGPNDVQ